MIVRSAAGVLYLITQPDHAALARRVMERWPPLHDAPRRTSILLAVEEHDNGWLEPDSTPTVHPVTGRPHDFIDAPAAVRQAVWPRGIQRLAEQDAWAAALVAEHALTVYDRHRGDTEWSAFFDDVERRRDRLLEEARRSRAELSRDYAFVRIGDLISLIFCNAWSEAQHFGEWQFQLRGDRVEVTPDPFRGHVVGIAVSSRQIPDGAYASDDALQVTVRRAPTVLLQGAVSGAP